MFQTLKKDIKAAREKDPAARHILEIVLCYQGFHAIAFHRLANLLWRRRLRLAARMLAYFSRWLTGVDIHPEAKIAPGVFIDHGAGVVIGQTAEVGEGCLLYQGSVLGGTSKEKTKRHPTLGRNVELGAGAIVLGPIKVGDDARIGAGSVVIRDVPPGATVIGVPGRISLGFTKQELEELQHGKLPDPVADAIKWVMREQSRLEERLKKLEGREGVTAQIDRVWEEKKREIVREFFSGEERFDSGAGI